MVSKVDYNKQRLKRHKRVRAKIFGTAERPRLNVFRSNLNIYAQIIDDTTGKTLVAANSAEKASKRIQEQLLIGFIITHQLFITQYLTRVGDSLALMKTTLLLKNTIQLVFMMQHRVGSGRNIAMFTPSIFICAH